MTHKASKRWGYSSYWLVGVAILFAIVFGPTIKKAIGLSFDKYRSYRYTHPLQKNKPGVRIKLSLGAISVKAYRRHDRSRLSWSLITPLSDASSCSTLVHKRAQAKAKASIPPQIGAMKIELKLNPFGRVTKAKITKSSLGKAHQSCLLWQLKGRKLYPPRGNRSALLRLGLKYVKAKPGVQYRGRNYQRRRGSKW